MKAGDPTISDLFNGNRVLEIPFFQRAYVWEEENWERFLDDMKDISSSNEEYFFGSLILKPKKEATSSIETKTLIDGQQRITTLIIFFKFLALQSHNKELQDSFIQDFRLKRGKKIALTHNHNDAEVFNDIVNMELYQEKLNYDKDYNSQIIKFYKYLVQNINVAEYDYDTIMNNIKFITIDLNHNEDEQKIFDTTNSLGVTLTTAELLKNHLFNSDQIDFYNSHWKNVFEKDNDIKEFWDQEITTGRFKRNNIDLFLYSYLHIKLQDKNINISSSEKANWGRANKLFNGYKKFIKETNTTKKELIEEIKEYAELYRKHIKYNVLDCMLTNNNSMERVNILIFGLETSVLIPYVLFILNNSSKEEVDKIFQYLESYIIRRIVSKSTNKNYNKVFSEEFISNDINTLKKLQKRINNKGTTTESMPSNEEVRNGFAESKISNKNATVVIYMLETKIRALRKHSKSIRALSDYSLEHLMPKNWKKNWGILNSPEEIDKRNTALLTLGNLAIITTSLNATIKDSDWDTKKRGVGNKGGLQDFAAGLETLNDALDKDTWDEEEITKRAHFLAQKSLEIWRK